MDRTIVHLDLDTFFVSVSRLLNPKLIGKPVIVGGTAERGIVCSCSYEARAFGVHAAMPSKLAKQLCPDAEFVMGDYDLFDKYSNLVTQVIDDNAPLYEKASIDEHYLDITGMDKFFGCLKWTKELRQKIIKETNLPISFGLSINKTVSKIATGEGKPNGEKQIERGLEIPFLAPLSVNKIPMIGEKTYFILRNMGVHRVKSIQEMPIEMMEKALGDNGITIWKKAHAIDNSPVEPYREQKSMSTESTFQQDSIDIPFLRSTIIRMVEQLSFDLRKQNRLVACITVKIRYSNFDTHTQQCKIHYTSSDHVLTSKALELFDKLYTRRMLVRLIGVKFSQMVYGNQQINLFEDTPQLINLYQAMDKMRKKYGAQAVMKSVGLK